MQGVIDYIKSLEVGKVQSYRSLAIAPLIGEDSRLDYLILSEAMRQGFEVNEVSAAGNVSLLYVENKTGKNVLAIAREHIAGGKQNRITTRNAYFAVDFKGKIPVNCSEAGRWNWRRPVTVEPEETERPPETEPAVPKTEPVTVFASIGTVPRNLVRSAEQQGKTWIGISHYLCRTGTRSGTSSFAAIYEQRKKDLKEFERHFSVLEGQVGVVVALLIDGRKLFIADVFDKNNTFQKYFSSFLRDYAVQSGLDSKGETDLTEQEARGFLDSVDSCGFKKITPISLGDDYEMRHEVLHGSSLCYDGTLVYANLFTPDKAPERKKELVAEAKIPSRIRTIRPRFRRDVLRV